MTHVLQGKTITKAELATDKHAIRFSILGEEPIIARTEGDCCSVSWIEHVELPAGGFPAVVHEVQDLALPGSCEDHPIYDCLQVYGLKITTDKGDMVIDYRNSSNGYYGGSLVWPDEDFYGGVFGQNESNDDFQPLTGDV